MAGVGATGGRKSRTLRCIPRSTRWHYETMVMIRSYFHQQTGAGCNRRHQKWEDIELPPHKVNLV